MKRNGFTLIEVILSLFLLGIISIIVLPSIQNSFSNGMKNKERSEMIYIAESTLEKLKAFKINSSSLYVYDMSVEDIIDQFKDSEKVDISLPILRNSERYIIEISKDIKGDNLWIVYVDVFYPEKRDVNVNFKAYLPKR